MGNTTTGMVATIVGRIVFDYFSVALTPIFGFSTDLSPTPEERGSAVTVPILPAPGTAGDLQNDHSGVRSNAVADFVTSGVTCTLNNQPIEGFHLTDTEVSKIAAGIKPQFIAKRASQCAYAVALSVLQDIWDLMTAANFSNIAITSTAANFDLDDVVDAGATLEDAGLPVHMPDGVVMGVKSTYRAALKKDNAIQDRSASGLAVVESGYLGTRVREQVDQFPLLRCPSLPTAASTPASENLVGFFASSDAIAIAQRAVVPQAPDRLEHFEVLQDPNGSGLSLCMRVWYDPDAGKMYYTFETLVGLSKANGSALYRIRSSA